MVIKILIYYLLHVVNFEYQGRWDRVNRDGSRAVATSEMEHFVIIVNGFQPLSIITKRSILDVATALDPPLVNSYNMLQGHYDFFEV